MPNRRVTCKGCQRVFLTEHSNQKFCTKICANGWYKTVYWKRYYGKNRKKYIKRATKYVQTVNGKLVHNAATKRQRIISPEKILARNLVHKALRNGTLTKFPCKCGIKKVQAHHDDYSKPLDVRWLCKKHHRVADQKLRSSSTP